MLQNGHTPVEFFAECRQLLADDLEWGPERFFVELLMSTAEYDAFFRLMRSEMQDIKRRNRK
jgi:hypothetical protein